MASSFKIGLYCFVYGSYKMRFMVSTLLRISLSAGERAAKKPRRLSRMFYKAFLAFGALGDAT